MSRHADPPDLPEGPPAPEPTFAERARTLLHVKDPNREGDLLAGEVATPEEARAVLIEMLEDARAKTSLL